MSAESTETREEFAGEMAVLVLGLSVCLPVGIYYYFANKEERQVCPACRETADMTASASPNCSNDL
ncbi:hypothetical protein NDI56_00480 [Haloarcula sp. S1CR25-12]|uniref:LITAF domain-containing protein n=1 Tax=Haloarcula saliterrae TaxID=2950534 RepID=A0ABU2F6I9_9EURY|nr:hypothetical protein [Haloarcula sp. S1CR25-12]MDS0257877.1 hypothetical protein [Haloarcula sp. S1CR25-12]